MRKRTNAGYEIIYSEIYTVDHNGRIAEIVIGCNENSKTSPYVVWRCYDQEDYCFGTYLQNWWDALEVYHTKLMKEYEHERDYHEYEIERVTETRKLYNYREDERK